jgi:hypothetical protein
MKKMGGQLDINSSSSRVAGSISTASSTSSSPASTTYLVPFTGGGNASFSIKDGRTVSSASAKKTTGLPPIDKSPPASRLLKK